MTAATWTPIVARKRRCVCCGILAERLDRAGYCLLCGYRFRHGREYVNEKALREPMAKKPRMRL